MKPENALYCSQPMVRRRRGMLCGYIARWVVPHSSYLGTKFVCGYHARAYTNVQPIAEWARERAS